jgi:hypothetical protein
VVVVLGQLEQNKNLQLLIVDRFESDFAVCEIFESENMVNIKKNRLIGNISEGDVLRLQTNGKDYLVDFELTAKRRNQVSRKLADLKNRK